MTGLVIEVTLILLLLAALVLGVLYLLFRPLLKRLWRRLVLRYTREQETALSRKKAQEEIESWQEYPPLGQLRAYPPEDTSDQTPLHRGIGEEK